MDDWNSSKTPSNQELNNDKAKTGDMYDFLSGRHIWHASSHARPIYCNICRFGLPGITSNGYSCEVCKMKIHKECKSKTLNNCKWTTLASIGNNIIEDQFGNISMPHQWIEGNLPVSSKCSVCDKICGSVLRLQDWRCLWCKLTVHNNCRPDHNDVCVMGPCKISVVPPIAIDSVGIDDTWETVRPHEFSPLLVFVNSKSGDNHGVKFLRRFKQLLNPAQVFDLMIYGPNLGLRLFQRFNLFRILICSGDGSVGWVLSEIDKLEMQDQCQVGVLPLGTGNDLARVLGWGSSCDDEANVPLLIERYERAESKLLDRWSVMTFEPGIAVSSSEKETSNAEKSPDYDDQNLLSMKEYEQSVSSHLTKILVSENPIDVISGASALCETVKALSQQISKSTVVHRDEDLSEKCHNLKLKLDVLLNILQEEETSTNTTTEQPSHEQLLSRTNSLKHVVRNLVEEKEKTGDERDEKKPVDFRYVINYPSKNEMSKLNLEVGKPEKLSDPKHRISLKFLKDEMNYRATVNKEKWTDKNQNISSPVLYSNLEKTPSISLDNHLESNSCRARSKSVDYNDKTDDNDDDYDSDNDQFEALPSALSEEMLGKLNHIDSSETSDDNPETNLSVSCSARSTTDFDNTENGKVTQSDFSFKESRKEINRLSITKRLETDSIDNPTEAEDFDALSWRTHKLKRCSIAHFIEGHDIAKKSIKCKHERFNKTGKFARQVSSHTDELDSTLEAVENMINQYQKTMVDEKLSSIIHEIDQKLLTPLNLRFEKLSKPTDKNDFALRSPSLSNECQVSAENLSASGKFEKPNVIENQFSKFGQNLSAESNSSVNSKSPTHPVNMKVCFKSSNGSLTNSTSCNKMNASLESGMNRQCLPDFTAEVISKLKLSCDITASGPSVIVNPPSPPEDCKTSKTNFYPPSPADSRKNSRTNIPVKFRRYSYDSCRRLSAASPLTLLNAACPSRRISNHSLLHPDSADGPSLINDKRNHNIKALPIINPLVKLSMWPNVSGTSLISNALLANADALCAAAVPLMDPDESLMEGYFEKVVMNNYFGIGIDAQISLDFHNKREEHPEKCKSRARNYMWYGVLGSKQWLQKTYKNLEQRVQLECDGYRIPLPHLQGIVILNIPSFMGGTNFWGGTKEDEVFIAPAVDDEILEVVAVFGSMQMAASRLINLQHHRIAQCRSVQIIISGEEGVPIQVDGEAWVQPPGMIRIIHKNRVMMLRRSKSLERSLKTWEDTMRHLHCGRSRAASTTMTPSKLNVFTEEETQLLLDFLDSAATLVKCIKLITVDNPTLKNELHKLAFTVEVDLENMKPGGKILQGTALRLAFKKLFFSTKHLHDGINLLHEKFHNLHIQPDMENQLQAALFSVELDLRKCHIVYSPSDQQELVYLTCLTPEESKINKTRKGRFRLLFHRTSSASKATNPLTKDSCASLWTVAEVCAWLDSLHLGEYGEMFQCHDIRGKELVVLTKADLKKMGITKVGHVIRISQAIKDLST